MKRIYHNGFKGLIQICLISGISLLLIVTSCENYQFDPPTIDPSAEQSFSNDVLPIFTAKCAACHNGSIAPDLTVENAYESIASGYLSDDPVNDPESSELYQKLIDSGHTARTTALEKSVILEWIRQGARDN